MLSFCRDGVDVGYRAAVSMPQTGRSRMHLGTVSLTGELTGPIVGIENKSTKKSSRSSRILASARAPESPVRVSGGVSPPPSFRVSLVCGLQRELAVPEAFPRLYGLLIRHGDGVRHLRSRG